MATDAELETVKREFQAKGIETSGGVTLAAGGSGGQFGTFDYENPADRAECERAVRLIARHFDEVILDDFFFYTSKSDADIAAKGNRSWTEYRVDKMREASRDLVLRPAKQENPRVRVIIKYPNWYEHFQGLGYDLAEQPKMFDAIYTGTETRDPEITDQLLQQYESYEIYRYFSNVRPGANLGGWATLRYPIDRPLRRAIVGRAVRQGARADAVQLAPDGGGRTGDGGRTALGETGDKLRLADCGRAERRLGERCQRGAAHRRCGAQRQLGNPIGHCELPSAARDGRGLPPQLHRQSRHADRALSRISGECAHRSC